MIGSGFKKFAEENGLKVAKGVAYGNLRGFAATLSEGSGYKMIVLTTKFTDAQKQNELQVQINGRNITRDFRVRSLSFAPNGVTIVFNDTVGTMDKIRAFTDWFFPLLADSSATGWDICTECGSQIAAGTWKLIDGVAFYMHEACAQRTERVISEEEQSRRDADNGSYLSGLLGALGGSALGAVVWGLVLYLGYVASVVGLLIGWLAEKGYNLFHGKQGKGKIAILAVAVVFGVVLGTFGAYAASLFAYVVEAGIDMGFMDVLSVLVSMTMEDAEFQSAVLADLGQGMLFAALGVVFLLIQANKQVSGTKIETIE